MSGYDTQFLGEFRLNKQLSPQLHKYLKFFSAKKRVKWSNLPAEFGEDGEYYYDGMDDYVSMYMFGKNISDYEPSRVEIVKYPDNQPNYWCNWTPAGNGTKIVWNMRKNSNNYVTWLKYIINNFLSARGYLLNGKIFYCGDCTQYYAWLESEISTSDETMSEDSANDDFGYIEVKDNIIYYSGPIGEWEKNIVENNLPDVKKINVKIPNYIVYPLSATLFGIYTYYLFYGSIIDECK